MKGAGSRSGGKERKGVVGGCGRMLAPEWEVKERQDGTDLSPPLSNSRELLTHHDALLLLLLFLSLSVSGLTGRKDERHKEGDVMSE